MFHHQMDIRLGQIIEAAALGKTRLINSWLFSTVGF